jgi:gamma-D-glutamyl-L-lysine dipeptidyl-peptidase
MKTVVGKQNFALQFGISLQAVIPMRKEPFEQSEMVSQLLFGEYYRVEDTQEKWLKVLTLFDHYSGWIDRKNHREVSQEAYLHYETVKPSVLASKIAEIGFSDSSTMLIPAGSSLPGYDPMKEIIVVPDGELRINPLFGYITNPPTQEITRTAVRFLNTPYLWGGRSSFGFDCSGFIQIVFKIHGISLPRDASQQATLGKCIHTFEEHLPGDLAFFASDEGFINHVGMIIASGDIIHCSGRVRIDRMEETGIFNHETGICTHRLKTLQRVM